tara:strand:- start:129 stop:1058 length:930 start_codon:yes stop_codon:yes gene_type:complete
MRLTPQNKKEIISLLPDFELSYEKLIHNKVHNYELCMAIPYGKKYLAWFTTYNKHYVCIFLEIDKRSKKIYDIKIMPCCFDRSLCFNTLFYGTIINNKFFIIEDILIYENSHVGAYNSNKKLNLINYIFENKIKQISYIKKDIVFGLPLLNQRYEMLLKEIDSLPYQIYSIQFYTKNVRLNYIFKNENRKQAVFMIKPDIQNDIYNLYISYEKTGLQFYDVACIPDFTTSVKMNKLFRNIKENINLDTLEESDDEEEFQNVNLSKYVDLDKRYNMTCVYNHKFKKWVPLEIVKNKNVITDKELKILQKK